MMDVIQQFLTFFFRLTEDNSRISSVIVLSSIMGYQLRDSPNKLPLLMKK